MAILGTSDHCIANYPGDFAVALAALDAQVDVEGPAGRRTLAFADLHRLPGDTPHLETTLRPDELILGFRIAAAPWMRRSLYLKIRDRQSYEFALASAAVALDLDGGVVREARVALGGVAAKPWRSAAAEDALRGRPLDETRAQAAAQAAFAEARAPGDRAFKTELGPPHACARAPAMRLAGDLRCLVHNNPMGPPTLRIDGFAKVTGQARYADDEAGGQPRFRLAGDEFDRARAHPQHGSDRGARGSGRARHSDPRERRRRGEAAGGARPEADDDDDWRATGSGSKARSSLSSSPTVSRRRGRRATGSRSTMTRETPSAGFDSPGVETERKVSEEHKDPSVGDADAAFAAAPVQIDAALFDADAAPQPHRTVHDDLRLGRTDLTIYEPTQGMYSLRGAVAKQLGMEPDLVRTISRFVGGGFGSKGAPGSRTAWIAIAAKRLGRPVRLVPTRAQGFTIATYRAETRHRLRLAAGPRRQARRADPRGLGTDLAAVEIQRLRRRIPPRACTPARTSRPRSMWSTPTAARRVHARAARHALHVRARKRAWTSSPMRSNMDPVELRRINDAQPIPSTASRSPAAR